MSGWVDLAYDDEDMSDMAAPTMSEKPQYPYGTRICFCGRELEKLGLPLPQVGDLLDMRVMAVVTSVSDGEGGQRVEMQIQMVGDVEDEDTEGSDLEAAENAPVKTRRAGNAFYGGDVG